MNEGLLPCRLQCAPVAALLVRDLIFRAHMIVETDTKSTHYTIRVVATCRSDEMANCALYAGAVLTKND